MLRPWFAALLTIGLATPAVAQREPMTAPIPVDPRPTQSGAGAAPGSTGNAEQQQRLQQGGSPADTTAPARAASTRPAGSMDDRYIRDIMAAGTITLQASTFARSKAQHPRVQLFAAWEEAEQNLMFEVLRGLAEPTATASTAERSAATAPVISEQGSAVMERMSRAQPGPAFDREYINLQLEKHRELATVHERFLGTNPTNREQAAIAKLALGQVREHIAHLENIARELNGQQQ